jgi:putative nucleotidyltransferase with HDIG domain
MSDFSKKIKIYISLVFTIGVLLAAYLIKVYTIHFNFDVFIFIIMAVIAESLLIPLPNQGGVSVGFAIVLPSIIFFGPGTAMLVILLENILMIVKQGDKFHHILNIPVYKTAFNTSMHFISAGIASLVYGYIGGDYSTFILGQTFIASIVAALVYIIINGLILAKLLAYINNTEFIKIWVSTLKWALINFIAISTLSVMIALAYGYFGIEAVILLFGPLLLARYSFKLYLDMKNNYMETIQALSAAMEQKDPYTQGHSQRVCDLSELLGKEFKLSNYEIEQLRYAAILHDIGKIGIPESILNKPGSLTNEEFNKIKDHPLMGVKILQKIDFLKEVTIIMESHHEYYDGSGYPKGLARDEIPFLSRIITLADAYDAMTTKRPYRDALSCQYAYDEIKDKSGSQFDPRVVDVFEKLYKEGKVVDA